VFAARALLSFAVRIDQMAWGAGKRSRGYEAIRGREDQLYDRRLEDGMTLLNIGRPVSLNNSRRQGYLEASNFLFGPCCTPYSEAQ